MAVELREIGVGDDAEAARIWAAAGGGTGDREAPLPAGTRRIVAMGGGRAVARAAFGAQTGFSGAPGVTGFVGWYHALDTDAGAAVLRLAATELLQGGAARVVGPLDGSTWYRYRVTLPREAEIADGDPFLSEPRNPPEWADQFVAAGFEPLLEYETRRVRAPAASPALAGKRAELERVGVSIRPLTPQRFEQELEALHELSVEAFAGNPFYLPIDFDRFSELYLPLRALIDPSLVRLAYGRDERLLAYVFALPDARSGTPNPRIVLKTLAVRTEARGLGLAAVLVDDIHAAAAVRGAAVLHALMQVSNASRTISGRSDSELFRRYRLYGIGGG